jgi:hypothetical protein
MYLGELKGFDDKNIAYAGWKYNHMISQSSSAQHSYYID